MFSGNWSIAKSGVVLYRNRKNCSLPAHITIYAMITPAIFLFFAGIVAASPHGWGWGQNQGQYYPQGQQYPYRQRYPQNYPQEQYSGPMQFDPNAEKPRVKFVEGSMDDLMTMDTQWICTNQKTGDAVSPPPLGRR